MPSPGALSPWPLADPLRFHGSPLGGKNLKILGADVAGQCLQQGLVDEIPLTGSLPVCSMAA